jgi:GNAT superfamily N-acetyltransferase
MNFKRVASDIDCQLVAELGDVIWREHYTPIIGSAQVEYMLDHFQSITAIKKQIAEGVHYYLVENEDENVGYLSFYPKEEALFISKIYVLSDQRGKGLGKGAIGFIENNATDLGLDTLRLTVNKFNTNSITSYEKMGFFKKEAVVIDIGGGFVMDDYVMEKALEMRK